MNKFFKNNQGITLVEVLTVLVLMSLILFMISGIQRFGQNQFINQNKNVQNQENVQYAVKYITKEIRKSGTFEVAENGKLIIGTDEYTEGNSTIDKNGQPFIEGIIVFDPKKIGDGKMKLTIESIEDSRGQSEKIVTTIYQRKGDE
ncbi:prepilin-type N-terminal cleavage/methylation domain-containing protein [Sporosarcina soli]|uniref:Prepilin-type N-terminal cleavage/methylation domain-containing protein n=1 Tax=Sporosarcina soli TaxID=334736 RepID=A0ABW0TPD1_9BACL